MPYYRYNASSSIRQVNEADLVADVEAGDKCTRAAQQLELLCCPHLSNGSWT
jgi:hypothetical protein